MPLSTNRLKNNRSSFLRINKHRFYFVDAIGFEPMNLLPLYMVTPQRSPYMHPFKVEILARFLSVYDCYLYIIPLIWIEWTLYSTDKFQLFEPSVGFKPTVRISILITSQAESFTVPRRRNAPKQFIFTLYLGLYRNLLSMASSFKRIQF